MTAYIRSCFDLFTFRKMACFLCLLNLKMVLRKVLRFLFHPIFTMHKSDFCHESVTDNLLRCMITSVRD